jgi:hypothetical protein
LFQCVDIEFAEPGDPKIAEVNETNCFNTTELGFAEMYTITTQAPGFDPERSTQNPGSGAQSLTQFSTAGWLPLLITGLWLLV